MMLYHQTPCDRGVFFFFDVIVKLVLILAVANSEQQERTDGGKSNQAANALYPRGSTIDPSSYSNVERFQPNHISFDSLVIDFDTYTITGTVTHTLTSLDSNASIMYMDVWDGIDLHSAKFRTQSNATNTSHSSTNYSKWTDVPFDITTPNPNIGNSIDIMLPISIPKGDAVYIRFEYTTISNGSLALYWTLPDYLTSDDDNSMMIGDTINNTGMIMYSLCQMNNCRDFAPMMDTPSQKVTYNASVIVPTAYNGVYMSANKTSVRTYNNTHTMYTFESTIPIPTYLIAIVVGSNTQEHFLNDRISIIASDSQTLESALTAFNDLPKVFDIVEEYLKIPYFWGNYSVFIMPSSFPTEGMEHPVVNFVSSTLVFNETYGFSTVIHEFTHSYFGNDVTCVNWNHFWINEGLDVFMERKVWEIMLGDDDLTKTYCNEGNQGLLQDMFNYGMNDSYTSLFPNVGENDPEDSYSYVPYEKGSQFIYYIETLIGKDKMQFMLHQYLTNFSNLAIDQQQFKEFYERFLYNNFDETSAITIINETRWDDWIYGRGLPPITLNFTINKESVQPTKSPTASSSSADRGNSYVPELLLCLTLSSILLSVLSR